MVEYVYMFLLSIIIIFGVLGNTFTAVVALRKCFRTNYIGVYMLGIAILDNVSLLCDWYFHRLMRSFTEVRSPLAISDTGCGILWYL